MAVSFFDASSLVSRNTSSTIPGVAVAGGAGGSCGGTNSTFAIGPTGSGCGVVSSGKSSKR
jgi:hypothetical protein